MVIGLRSRILSSFPRFSTESTNFNPCDIPALVPLVALLANGGRGLDDGGFIREDSTRILLQFSGEQTRSITSLKALAVNVHQFMTRWEQWVNVLLGTLASDPNIRDWRIDWHELLAGESGYFAMPWFPEVPLTDRALALDRIVAASRALLNSVLKMGFQKNELVEELVNWLDGLKPQPEVLRAEVFAEQEVV